MQRRIFVILIIFLISLTPLACSSQDDLVTSTPDSSLYAVDPVFRQLYSYLGGRDILGEAISPARERNGLVTQYTIAGQLVFDPQATAAHRFQLGALGKNFAIAPQEPSRLVIAEPFLALYNKLGGAVFVGLPITPPVYNQEKDRTEQYFENLGFYQGPETDGIVRLLPYGAWSCDASCRNITELNAIVEMPRPTFPVQSTALILEPTLPPTPEPTKTILSSTSAAPVAHQWTLQVWSASPVVAVDQVQEIGVKVNRDGAAYSGAKALLVVELPDKTILKKEFPPSDADGIARVQVEPLDVQNGKNINYQVCLTGDQGDSFCVLQSYLVWSRP
jgi:hypothetical protein